MQVPETDVRLAGPRVAALVVGVVADVAGVEAVEKAERAVVDCQAEDRHVVGVHHAVAEPDRLPRRHQFGGAVRDLFEQRDIRLRGVAAGRVMVVDHKIGEPAQRVGFA